MKPGKSAMKKIDFHCHIYHPKEYEARQSWMTSRMLNPHFWMTAPCGLAMTWIPAFAGMTEKNAVHKKARSFRCQDK
jgi:hypothetical protein